MEGGVGSSVGVGSFLMPCSLFRCVLSLEESSQLWATLPQFLLEGLVADRADELGRLGFLLCRFGRVAFPCQLQPHRSIRLRQLLVQGKSGLQVVESQETHAVSSQNYIGERLFARKHQITVFVFGIGKDETRSIPLGYLTEDKRKSTRRSRCVEQLRHRTLLLLAIFANELQWRSLPFFHHHSSNSHLRRDFAAAILLLP